MFKLKDKKINHNFMYKILAYLDQYFTGSVPAVESENRPVVTYGKHLCGPATGLIFLTLKTDL